MTTSSTSEFERRIALAGATNFRDLGGYASSDGRTVRWRQVYRADALHDLTPEDVEALSEIGLRHVLDLRTARELEAFGTNPLTVRGIQHHHVPFVPEVGADRNQAAMPNAREWLNDVQLHASHYLDMLELAKPSVARVLTHVAEFPGEGAVFHCTGGRDRTGMTAALLLEVLGVDRETIAEDYALTSQYLVFSVERRERMRAFFGGIVSTDDIPPAQAAVMSLTLAGLDERYGSVEAYLQDAGVTSEHRDSLRASLLEG